MKLILQNLCTDLRIDSHKIMERLKGEALVCITNRGCDQRSYEMEYRKANTADLEGVYQLVQETIKGIYPNYYPMEIVDFFCDLHNKEKILIDIEKQEVSVLIVDDEIIGTGCHKADHITRVYVSPKYQGMGYGTFIMHELETEIAQEHGSVYLDASLPACLFYEKLGYHTREHGCVTVEHGVILVYSIMDKTLSHYENDISYDGRRFVSKSNTNNGEVDAQTVFCYHQKGSLLYAEYTGGEIQKGYLIGTVDKNRELDFYYLHRNQQEELRIGVCHSIPEQLEDGRIRLREQWKWLNHDQSFGESTLEEIRKE